eukprot:2057872-Rhodomonas_salina.1
MPVTVRFRVTSSPPRPRQCRHSKSGTGESRHFQVRITDRLQVDSRLTPGDSEASESAVPRRHRPS